MAALTVIAALALAVSAASAGKSMADANNAEKHAEGAAKAQATAMDAQVKTANDETVANKSRQSQTAQAGASQKMAAILASMTSQGAAGGTITGASKMDPAQTTNKTLLGA